MTTFITPMKAKLSDKSFLAKVDNDTRYGAGEKFDGYREELWLGADHNELSSSEGNSHIGGVPQFTTIIPEFADTLLDCEGLSPTRRIEDNATCFKCTYHEQSIAWQKTHGQAFLAIFDILRYKGLETLNLTFDKRRVLLEIVVNKLISVGMPVRMEELVMTNKLTYYEMIVARTKEEGHEGIILKNMQATYKPGNRNAGWLKVKRFEKCIYPICGFVGGTGKYSDMIGAIVYGNNEGTASGMTDEERQDMTDRPEKYKGKLALFECQEITDNHVMRHPRYIRMLTAEEVKERS